MLIIITKIKLTNNIDEKPGMIGRLEQLTIFFVFIIWVFFS
jgi:hypothetical protein